MKSTPAQSTKQITHGELKAGMLVFNSGILFEVSDVAHTEREDENGNVHICVRYSGKILDGKNTLANSVFNGGRYGAWAWVPCTIQITEQA